jgi:hypothetical protein
MIAFSLGHAQELAGSKAKTRAKHDNPMRHRLANTVRLPGPSSCRGNCALIALARLGLEEPQAGACARHHYSEI